MKGRGGRKEIWVLQSSESKALSLLEQSTVVMEILWLCVCLPRLCILGWQGQSLRSTPPLMNLLFMSELVY